MAGNHRHDSPGPESGAYGFLARWSERKRAGVSSEAVAPPEDTRESPVAGSGAHPPETIETQKPLTDQDMPSLESLNEESDYSGFLSPGVSEALHRLALRKLFGAAKFQVRDGLDDYDTDYNRLQPLHRVLAGVSRDELGQALRCTADKRAVDAEDNANDTAGGQARSAAVSVQQDDRPEPDDGHAEEAGT